MKNAIVLLLLIILSNTAYSRIGFPLLTLSGKDTIACINLNQIKSLNLLWVSYNEQLDINSELTKQISEYNKILILDYYIHEQDSNRLQTCLTRVSNRDEQLEENKTNIKSLNRKEKFLKLERAGLGVVSVFLAALLIIKENKQ